MKVKNLIEKLQQLDPEMKVVKQYSDLDGGTYYFNYTKVVTAKVWKRKDIDNAYGSHENKDEEPIEVLVI